MCKNIFCTVFSNMRKLFKTFLEDSKVNLSRWKHNPSSRIEKLNIIIKWILSYWIYTFNPIMSKMLFLFIFLSNLFILRERAWAGVEQKERERERILSRLCTVITEPDAGLELMNHKILTWAESKSQALNWLSHPGTP